jgi:hypothetical protein
MTRSQTVELPPIRRAPGGWALYEAREESICPRHQFCAYTGDEPGLCAVCHSSLHDTDDHGDLPPHQVSRCLCAGCQELFTSISSFDQHQRPAGVCRNPAKRGLVLVKKTDRYGTVWQMWAKPGSRPDDL